MKRSITRYGARLVVLGAASAFCLAYTSQARAAEVWMEEQDVGGRMEGVVKYVAAPGETNAVTVTRSGGSIIVSEAGGPGVTAHWGFGADWGCDHGSNLPASVARCVYPHGRGIVQADLALRDGDDRATVGAALRTNIDGGAGSDRLTGGPGRDRVIGGDGIDVLAGGGDCDKLFGDGASDWLDGGAGADVLDGGAGKDYADYSQRTTGVSVSLDGPPFSGTSCASLIAPGFVLGANDGDSAAGEGDNVHDNVEGIWGGAGSDALTGNAFDNLLDGGSGDDGLEGRGGRDELLGGPGNDRLTDGSGADVVDGGDDIDSASYEGRPTRVYVNLDGLANDGESSGQEGNNIIRVENVTGTYYNDALIGDNADNIFYGLEGDDYYRGGGGADQLIDGGSLDSEGGSDYFDARDLTANDSVYCGNDLDADDADEFDFVLAEELVDGSKSDQLNGSCDEFNLTYLPVITAA